MGDRPQVELLGALRQLYESREYADLTLVSRDGTKHSVHKSVVCPRSSFVADAVKERKWASGAEGEVALLEDEAEMIRLVIEYLYLLDYEPEAQSVRNISIHSGDSDGTSVRTDPVNFGHVYGTSAVSAFGGPRDSLAGHLPYATVFGHSRDRSESQLTVHALPGADFSALGVSQNRRRMASRSPSRATPDPSPLAAREPNLTVHARVYAAAARYGIGGLKALALDKFKIQLTRHWDCQEFGEAINVVYNSTASSDKEMREAVANTIGWHGRLLDKPEIEIAIMEINGLAYELLKRARRAEPEYD